MSGKVFLGSTIEVRNLSGRRMVLKWYSKQWLFSKSKKSKHFKASSEGERVIDMLDDMRIQAEEKALEREKEEAKGFNSLLYGLFIFVMNSANSLALAFQTQNGHSSSMLNQAFRTGIHAAFIGAIYVTIIGISISVAIKENRLDFNHIYRLCKNLFWLSVIFTIISFFPIIKNLTF